MASSAASTTWLMLVGSIFINPRTPGTATRLPDGQPTIKFSISDLQSAVSHWRSDLRMGKQRRGMVASATSTVTAGAGLGILVQPELIADRPNGAKPALRRGLALPLVRGGRPAPSLPRHAGLAWDSGRDTEKTVPPSGREWTSIRPSWSSTIRRVIARPRPVPSGKCFFASGLR